jgi:hypothetical protein
MTLIELIRKRKPVALATATLATVATLGRLSGSSVAGAQSHRENCEPTSTIPDVVIEPAAQLPPLQPGWLVAYRDRRGALRGGCDDRQHGTVDECQWEGKVWTVYLTDGQRLPLSIILSVGKTDSEGKLIAAWTVREHGYDGEGTLCNRGEQNAI